MAKVKIDNAYDDLFEKMSPQAAKEFSNQNSPARKATMRKPRKKTTKKRAKR